MMACAFTGPIPGSASSSSLVAVLMLTAACATRVDGCCGSTIEGRCATRAHIENTGPFRVVEELQVDLDDIVDTDKVAALFARRVAAGPLEQLHLTASTILVEKVVDDRG